jgi:hypothetical protein
MKEFNAPWELFCSSTILLPVTLTTLENLLGIYIVVGNKNCVSSNCKFRLGEIFVHLHSLYIVRFFCDMDGIILPRVKITLLNQRGESINSQSHDISVISEVGLIS